MMNHYIYELIGNQPVIFPKPLSNTNENLLLLGWLEFHKN